MVGFVLSDELSPVLSRFLDQRSPIAVSRTGSAERPALWSALATEVGVVGLLIPEAFGGQGATVVELAAAVHETGRVGWSGPLVAASGVAAHLLAALDPSDAAGLQSALASGQVVIPALHEDLQGGALATTARIRGGSLAARKVHVDSGTHADGFLVPAVDDGGRCVLAFVDAADANVRAQETVDAGRGLATVTVDGARATIVAAGGQVLRAVEDAWLVGALQIGRASCRERV